VKPFDEGTVDFEGILAALPDDWDGTLSLEIKSDGFEVIGQSKPRLERARGVDAFRVLSGRSGRTETAG
jgi:sugar phosphate isomerase/epimerase